MISLCGIARATYSSESSGEPGLEDELDDIFLSEPIQSTNGSADSDSRIEPGSLTGDWHFETYLVDRYFSAFNKDKLSAVKHETHLKFDTGYSGRNYGFFSSLDGYLVYKDWFTNDSMEVSIDLRELYLEGRAGDTRFRLGKQLLSWGVGDLFQVTNYHDQLDLRQMLVIDPDDRLRGTPLLMIGRYLNDLALEIVATPYYAPVLMPEPDSFWAIALRDQGAIEYRFSEHYEQGDDLFRETNYENNSSVAIRFGGVMGNVDAHISYYNGISRVLLAQPRLKGSLDYVDGQLVSLQSHLAFDFYKDRSDTFGFDFASSVGRSTYRFEIAYTPNQAALLEPEPGDILQALESEVAASSPLPGTGMLEFSADVVSRRTQPYLTWVIGTDYNYRGVNGFFLIEWTRGRYLGREEGREERRDLDNPGDYIEPLLDDILLLRWEDKFFNERFHMELSCLIGPVKRKHGSDINLELSWDFKNGFIASSSLYLFNGRGNNFLFDQLDRKDIARFSLSYQF